MHDDQFSWPGDYVPLDGGRFRVRPDCLSAFDVLGWRSFDDVMNATNLDVVRRLDARDNCVVELPTGAGPILGYVKRHRVRSLRRRYLESGRGRAAASPGLAEANAAGWCHSAGVPALTVIAAGERLLGQRRSDSFFISQELTGCTPANDYWFPFDQRDSPPDAFASDSRARLTAINTVAKTARLLHRANLFHADLYLEHFFVSPGPARTAFLVDLQRVERLSGLARMRAKMKDLCQVHGSFNRYRLNEAEREEFLTAYVGNQNGTVSFSARAHMQAAATRWSLRRLRRTIQKRGRRAA